MISELQKSIIKRLSFDIPVLLEPYKYIAEELKISEEELIDNLKDLNDKGILRRISGILYHRHAGYGANAMVVWTVPEDRIEEIGSIVCFLNEVTHCYQRPTFPNWPYNFFTMVHSETKKQCEEVIKKISDAINIYDYEILYSTRELKKSSMKYFNELK